MSQKFNSDMIKKSGALKSTFEEGLNHLTYQSKDQLGKGLTKGLAKEKIINNLNGILISLKDCNRLMENTLNGQLIITPSMANHPKLPQDYLSALLIEKPSCSLEKDMHEINEIINISKSEEINFKENSRQIKRSMDAINRELSNYQAEK